MYRVYEKEGQKAYGVKWVTYMDAAEMANKAETFKAAIGMRGSKRIMTVREVVDLVHSATEMDKAISIYFETEEGSGKEIKMSELGLSLYIEDVDAGCNNGQYPHYELQDSAGTVIKSGVTCKCRKGCHNTDAVADFEWAGSL